MVSFTQQWSAGDLPGAAGCGPGPGGRDPVLRAPHCVQASHAVVRTAWRMDVSVLLPQEPRAPVRPQFAECQRSMKGACTSCDLS